ncbi:imelysin family protein [Winogradskyella sp. UBA3174]|uniref:imelysin family protein n=1 Tax=Winogradskyella sp. UBA3174 TaxID=1947785 RepID=UPI0025DD15FA|nr:imelysin family protein [Winogradskyella sp. UBA3174]|tara:strand:+ start:96 stop:1181 length:1086 start_codon:yes stop_codon:yes gene_type:complete
MKKFTFTLIAIASIIIIACSSSDSDASDQGFNVKNFLDNAVNLNIKPALNTFNLETSNLEQSISTYTNNPTVANLELARQQWKTTAINYEKTYVYHIGLARTQFLHNSIYNWPTVEGAIEYFISDNDSIDATFMATISSQAKSLAAIEYLLFAENAATINSGFMNSEKRRDYLRLSSIYLKTRADKLQNVWATSGEDYGTTFINNSGSGIQGSFNLYYNGIHNALDVTKSTKVGKPAGLENSQVINPELTQAYFSDTSKALVRVSIESVETAYFNTAGLGIDDYVFSITNNQDLNDAILNKINEIYAALNAMSLPLDEAVNQSNAQVEVLHTKIEDLRILFAVDVRSVLSIIITTTDTDGD